MTPLLYADGQAVLAAASSSRPRCSSGSGSGERLDLHAREALRRRAAARGDRAGTGARPAADPRRRADRRARHRDRGQRDGAARRGGRASGAALITITHDANVAALARRHYRLDRGVLLPVDVNRVLALSLANADPAVTSADRARLARLRSTAGPRRPRDRAQEGAGALRMGGRAGRRRRRGLGRAAHPPHPGAASLIGVAVAVCALTTVVGLGAVMQQSTVESLERGPDARPCSRLSASTQTGEPVAGSGTGRGLRRPWRALRDPLFEPAVWATMTAAVRSTARRRSTTQAVDPDYGVMHRIQLAPADGSAGDDEPAGARPHRERQSSTNGWAARTCAPIPRSSLTGGQGLTAVVIGVTPAAELSTNLPAPTS